MRRKLNNNAKKMMKKIKFRTMFMNFIWSIQNVHILAIFHLYFFQYFAHFWQKMIHLLKLAPIHSKKTHAFNEKYVEHVEKGWHFKGSFFSHYIRIYNNYGILLMHVKIANFETENNAKWRRVVQFFACKNDHICNYDAENI